MVAYSFKKQFIRPILIGLGASMSADEFAAGMDEFGNVARPEAKRQTIRSLGKRRHARPGETIQLYTAMRTKQCRKLGEALCKSVSDIRIFVHREVIRLPCSQIEGGALDAFARADGFADWPQMKQFWIDEHGELVKFGPFVGVLIQWEAVRGK